MYHFLNELNTGVFELLDQNDDGLMDEMELKDIILSMYHVSIET